MRRAATWAIELYWGEGVCDDVPALAWFLVSALVPLALGLTAVASLASGTTPRPRRWPSAPRGCCRRGSATRSCSSSCALAGTRRCSSASRSSSCSGRAPAPWGWSNAPCRASSGARATARCCSRRATWRSPAASPCSSCSWSWPDRGRPTCSAASGSTAPPRSSSSPPPGSSRPRSCAARCTASRPATACGGRRRRWARPRPRWPCWPPPARRVLPAWVAGTTPVRVFLVLAGVLVTCYLAALALLVGAALAVRRERRTG